jgi:signal transduction histidine kinase
VDHVPARTLAGFAAAVCAILIAVAAYFLVAADRDRRAAGVTERSEALRSLERLEDALVRAESAQRGYLLTREDRLLESYRAAVADIHADLDGVREVATGRRDGVPREALVALVEAKLAELRRVVEVREADGLGEALRQLRSGDGTWLTEAIEAVRAEMEAIAGADLREHRRAWFGSIALADAIFLGANLLLLLLVVTAGLATRAEMRRRDARALERLRMIELQERILGIVSHDLRNPLSAIQNGATLLARSALPPPQARIASLMQSSSRRMEGILRDLLDYIRTRAGTGIPLAIGTADVGEVCARVVDETSLFAGVPPVELRREGDLAGEWDADRLEQAIGNLVANAVRHAPAGTPVRVRAIGEGDGVRIDVENDGPAIAPETAASLFEPFQRGTGPVTGGDGLGLGLFIVRTIVEAHGGTVHAEAAVAPPVTFTVRLPRARARRAGAPPPGEWRPTRPERSRVRARAR